ncbi:MAG: hypothetical protein FWB96_11820 [Defluviitaleaceae bacterium]|nr:hypothetical protein [Defluviitaleaceae bacterium]MCL2263775.1 hypothetical protein [Defluviitaleaceae bacterium]
MQLAAQIGIPFSEFWDMTPRELNIYAKGYGERVRKEFEHRHNCAIVTAYLASRWVWAKRANVKKYLAGEATKQQKIMTDAELFSAVQAFHAQFSGRKE